jgi:hypothetical protein
MGNKLAKHQKKIAKQKMNKHENEVYYQKETRQKTPRTEAQLYADRRG